MSNNNPVVHFEMPYEDAPRVADFYKKAFGWNMEVTAEDMGGYVLAETVEVGENGRPTMPGAINGGFFPKKSDWPDQHPSVVIAVDNIQTAVQAVKDAGGEVLGEPMNIPGVGIYISFYDSEHNRVSLLQAST